MRPVLLIDDDIVSLNVTEAIVQSLNPNWKVVKIPSAAEGLELMLRIEPTPLFALLDLQMPEMDGFQLLEECKRRTGNLGFPVFLLSAHITTEVAERAADVPFIRCVFPKPVHSGSLMYHLLLSGVQV